MNVATIDRKGRKSARTVPDDADEKTWVAGVLIGPPDLTSLGLGEEVTTKLHNELYNRGIIRRSDAKTRRSEVHAALMASLRIDADRIISLYEEQGNA